MNGSESGLWGRLGSCEQYEPSYLDSRSSMKIVNLAPMHEMTVYQPHFYKIDPGQTLVAHK